MKEPQIQIPKRVFVEVYKLIITLNEYDLDHDMKMRVQAIETAIEDKIEAAKRREAFGAYKAAEPSTADREAKRRKYLELAGVHKDWISPTETSS